MSRIRQFAHSAPPIAALLALALSALTASVLLLSARADTTPPEPCAVANQNGCTELSATPPQDTSAVPPNIVLMLDDSGSMAWDFMPDWEYLQDTSLNGVRDVAVNSLYYNPDQTYALPPKADSTDKVPDLYPNSPSLTHAYKDGFTDTTHYVNLTTYSGNPNDQNDAGATTTFRYWEYLKTASSTSEYPAVPGCTGMGTGYALVGGVCVYKQPNPINATPKYTCNPGDVVSGSQCRHNNPEGPPTYYPPLSVSYSCPSGTSPDPADNTKCVYPATKPNQDPVMTCPEGGSVIKGSNPPTCQKTTNTNITAFTFVKGPAKGPYTQYYVAAGTGCDSVLDATQKSHCINEGDTSGKFPDGTSAGPVGVPVGQNVANWFSYYSTRLGMTKSGLMTAFINLNPSYRFGFASINANGKKNIPGAPAPYGFNDASGYLTGDANNQLAVVQVFGDGTPGTQKALFWNWIANESANGGTPLRLALQAVGQYYQTPQPWTTMYTDPGWTSGSTAKYACRASYAILSTDGFWNGKNPSGIGNAAGTNGPVNTVPAATPPTVNITQYVATDPFSGGAATSGASLADVATYYWETDLMPGADWPNVVATSAQDPAAWQHMTTFTIGLGFKPTGFSGTFAHPDNPVQDIQAWATAVDAYAMNPTGPAPTPIPGFAWPTPSSNSLNNIADLAHAGINGHGEFFNVTKPTDLAEALTKAFKDIAAHTNIAPSAAVNASVLSAGALSFSTSYETNQWSGTFKALALNPDGTTGAEEWSSNIDAQFHSAAGYANRKVYTDAYGPAASPVFSAFQFASANAASLDATEAAGIGGATNCSAGGDTICARINYLLGDPTNEGGLYRLRPLGILGAIIDAQPVYVSGATGNYSGTWPTGSPEAAVGAQTYDTFVQNMSTRPGTVYVGANDGMLHAFDAPVPTNCVYSGTPPAATCNYNSDGTAGNERWAFVPRAVYANLGNLTNINFSFLRTVDATPVTRDVFFSSDKKWHTLLAGGVGLGGRGVYALDITNPASFSAANVLWEFDSDSSVDGCVSVVGTSPDGSCAASDLGFTVSQPNIGRITYGNKWVVLVPNGYFPDCTAPDIPTADTASCQAVAGQAPGWSAKAPYSALFVLDARTGAAIAELKTPQISGVTSFGLATPVMGTYTGTQVDTVAFAGDVEGNLWRFDLSAASPSQWTVTLVYQAPVQGAQPITTMPRLFPDLTTNRFMIVFGTGKFLGVGDNANATVQGVYGVRDILGKIWTQSNLTQQYLHEETLSSGPLSGTSVRCITGGASDTSCTKSVTALNSVPASSGGWFFNLQTTTSGGVVNDAGERVVATPGAVFSSNTVIVGTLITGAQGSDACSPSTQGSVLALNANTGGTAGVSALGGGAIAGARVTNAPTSGTLPVVSALGGGQTLPLGMQLAPSGKLPLSIDAPIWRRRSWNEINQN